MPLQGRQKVWRYVISFWHCAGIRQTDGRTELVKQYRALHALRADVRQKLLIGFHQIWHVALAMNAIVATWFKALHFIWRMHVLYKACDITRDKIVTFYLIKFALLQWMFEVSTVSFNTCCQTQTVTPLLNCIYNDGMVYSCTLSNFAATHKRNSVRDVSLAI